MMKRKILATCTSFFILTSGTLFAQTEPEEEKWYDKVDFSGFVDVYYQYNDNTTQGAAQDSSRQFEQYNKQFAVNLIELDIEKVAEKDSNWGFRLDLMDGQNAPLQEQPYAQGNQIFNMNMLQQAYVSFYFDIGRGVTVDMGKMATHIGYEVLESLYNPAYSIGAIFFNTVPFIHTGARASTSIADGWDFTVYLYNAAGGTGYSYGGYGPGCAAATGNLAGTPAGCLNGSAANGQSYYMSGLKEQKSVGTQLKGEVIPERLNIVWNTLFGNDPQQGIVDPGKAYLAQQYNGAVLGNPTSRWASNHWNINDLIVSWVATDFLTIDFNWTHGQKTGTYSPGYNTTAGTTLLATAAAANPNNVLLGFANANATKPATGIYDTFGTWWKFKWTEKFGTVLRYEYIDDKRYWGGLVHGPASQYNPNATGSSYTVGNYTTLDPTKRAYYQVAVIQQLVTDPTLQSYLISHLKDLKNYNSLGKTQYHTFTISPNYAWSENLVVKLDLRADWASGKQFVNHSGVRSNHQIGATLGVVAHF